MSLHNPSKRAASALAALLLATPWQAPAQENTPGPEVFASLQEQVQGILKRCGPSVVRVEAEDHHGQLSGSGFFIDPSGLLYTSYSVGGETQRIVVVLGDTKFPARRLVADGRCGIALLQVDTRTPFLTLGRSRDLAPGSPVIALGYPLGFNLTPSFGMLAGFDLRFLGRYFATTHLRANVAVQRGEGGAPLLNMKGEVVGILISSLDQATFALPIEAAEKIHRDFIDFKEVRPGWLGLTVIDAADAREGSTAEVETVFRGEPAQKAGLLPGDILLKVGDRPITCPEDMVDACFFLSPKTQVNIIALRGAEKRETTVEVSDHPNRRKAAAKLSLSDQEQPPSALKVGE